MAVHFCVKTSMKDEHYASLALSPCGPAARHGCWRSPPPASGNVWRRGRGSRSSRPAPSPRRWRWPCRRKWPCPCLPTRSQRSHHAVALITEPKRRRRRKAEANVPNSSRSTRECLVAWCRMLAVSLSSTKKVLSPGRQTGRAMSVCPQSETKTRGTPACVSGALPAMMRSEAPSRVKTRSTGVKRSLSAGT